MLLRTSKKRVHLSKVSLCTGLVEPQFRRALCDDSSGIPQEAKFGAAPVRYQVGQFALQLIVRGRAGGPDGPEKTAALRLRLRDQRELHGVPGDRRQDEGWRGSEVRSGLILKFLSITRLPCIVHSRSFSLDILHLSYFTYSGENLCISSLHLCILSFLQQIFSTACRTITDLNSFPLSPCIVPRYLN